MPEPNFSESQLQQAVNNAIIRYIFEDRDEWIFVNVPSLFDEFGLGWDSAFFFPWLPYLPKRDHEGSNFFLQYKLSGKLISRGAKEWQHWNSQYYRFKIPHSTQDPLSGKYIDDYHQWDRLKTLADQRYPVFYATNSVLCKDKLYEYANAGTLLNNTPSLDIRGIATAHKYVTFTVDSPFFLLHSEKEESTKVGLDSVIEKLSGGPQASTVKLNSRLLHSLHELAGEDEQWAKDLSGIKKMLAPIVQEGFYPWLMQMLISSFVQKHIGAFLIWLPKRGG